MASIRKRGTKWQAQVRRNGRAVSKTFTRKGDASQWAREMEGRAERGELQDVAAMAELHTTTLAEVLKRYQDEVTASKRCAETERCAINPFLRRSLARRPLDALTAGGFAAYRDERLRRVKPSTICRELGWLQHALDLAAREWGLPLPSTRCARCVDRV